MKCSKKAYKDARQARGVIRTISKSPNSGQKPIRAYLCPNCDMYHVTSATKEGYESEKERRQPKIPNLMNTLTDKEQQFLGTLETVDKESVWGIAISNVVANPQPHLVRRLIISLKEQARDCTEVMLSIIGEPGMKQLQNL